MRLLLWPVRHVAGADVAGEHLSAGHLRPAVDTIFQRAVVHGRRRQQPLVDQGGIGAAAERRHINREAIPPKRLVRSSRRRDRLFKSHRVVRCLGDLQLESHRPADIDQFTEAYATHRENHENLETAC